MTELGVMKRKIIGKGVGVRVGYARVDLVIDLVGGKIRTEVDGKKMMTAGERNMALVVPEN